MSEYRGSLKLGKIILKNYKKYKGTTTIDLSLDPNKTITIIHGEMGKGKTTLLGAIYWCLYGEPRSLHISQSDESIINNDAIEELVVGDSSETYVEIHLYEEDTLRYTIKRIVTFYKKSASSSSAYVSLLGGKLSNGVAVEDSVELHYLQPRGGGGDWRVYTNPEQVNDAIETVFPKSLSSYFLFDAELLDSFFNDPDGRNVKYGIEKISGLPIIDDAIRHIQKTSDNIIKTIKNVDIEPIKDKVFLLTKTIETNENTIQDANIKLLSIEREMDKIRSYMEQHNDAFIQQTQQNVNNLKENSKRINATRKTHQGNMKKWLLYRNTIVRLRMAMETSMAKCNTWENDGRIPIAVSGHALRNILQSSPPKCICGAHLEQGSDGRKNIEHLLEKNYVESPVIQGIATGRARWESIVGEMADTDQALNELRAYRNNLYDESEQCENETKKEQDKLNKHNVDEVRQKSQKLRELTEQQIQLRIRKEQAEREVELNTKRRQIEHTNLKISMEKDRKYTSHTNRVNLAFKLIALLKECRDSLVTDLRNKAAEKTTAYFLTLLSKKDDFFKVEIKQNYRTLALGHDEKSKDLSAGQTCCLALSYIAAIRDIAEKNYFMMIDSPLHNISQEERVDIARNLPKFLPRTQITLLVQDQEYTGASKRAIVGERIASVRETMIENKSVWKEYVLETSKKKGHTSPNTTVKEISIE